MFHDFKMTNVRNLRQKQIYLFLDANLMDSLAKGNIWQSKFMNKHL